MMNQKPDSTSLPSPVAVPLRRRWREFRIRYLPILVFLGTAVLVVNLWQGHVLPTQIIGLAVGSQFALRSPQDGYVANLQAQPFASVQAGAPLLHIQPADADQLTARLAIIRAEILSIRTGLAPVTGLQRSLLDYEDLRLDKMKTRVQLAIDQIEIRRLEREAERQTRLFESGLVTEAEHDIAMTRLEVTRTRIRENESLLDTLQKRLQEIAGTWGEHGPDADSALSASIQVKEEELLLVEAQIAPIPLYSPVDGIISAIHLPNGSFTRQGEVLVTVHAPQVEYVMGYIRQPVRTLPEIGTEVQILVPARNQWFSGMITHIGNQMVPVHDMLARTVGQTEYALPLRIQIAPDSPVLPGERIEIRL